MASLSHASFATPNTQQLSPTHKLLPSHLSMDPASSSSASLSTLSQPYSSAELASWLQKPNAKLSYSQLHTMSSFNHQYGISSPLYEGYAEAGDSVVEQGFIGGDDPLLTSSWEALDKLVSASMTGSGDGNDQISEFAYSSAQGSTLQSTSPSSMTGVEQKPLSALNIGINQKGGVCTMWENNQASVNNASSAHTTPSNVGLNLASLITADPGFVERAAKFSSYSQQAHNSSFNQCANNVTSTNNALSLENFNLACARKLASMSALCTNGSLLHRGDNVAMEHDDIKASTVNTLSTFETKQSISPQRSLGNFSGSKKKREEATKDGEVDDAGANVGRKRAKGGERTLDEEDIINGNNNSKVGRVSGGDEKTKVQQCMRSNSAESQQKSGGGKATVSKPNGSNTSINNNNGSSTASQAAPKPDFIHVRARRGQATDSHSLAERVRREKISERMKYLQDLVPGCTKVTGKAMMLDEIINYVQSLQRQVEFLSMKLAAVHPSKLEFNFESLFGKEVMQPSIVPNNQNVSYAPESLAHLKAYPLLQENVQQLQPHHQAFPEASSMQTYGSDAALRRSLGMLSAASSDTFGDQSISSQITDSWDEDLQSLVQLGFPQTPLNMNPSLHGALLQGQRKTEL